MWRFLTVVEAWGFECWQGRFKSQLHHWPAPWLQETILISLISDIQFPQLENEENETLLWSIV